MAEIKWIKLNINIFEDEKIRLIDAMPERDTIHYVWIRLLVQAGKINSNGFIFLSENIPYTDEMLATIFCRPLTTIRLALKILKDFGMIEIDEDNLIKIANWDKHQNIEGMDRVRAQNRKRAENYREKKKQLEAEAKEVLEDSIHIEDDKCNVTQNYCNAIENENNVTVTEQNKRETKNKKENKTKNKREIKNKNEICNIDTCNENKDLNLEKSEQVKSSISQSKNSIIENDKSLDDINTKCVELIKYCETIAGIPNVLNAGALKLAISMHGEEYVKMAIDIALKANKPNMTYIDGILKNWRREGYPKDKEEKKDGNRSYGKNSNADKNEFKGFKPNKPRKLTEAERKKAEEDLI